MNGITSYEAVMFLFAKESGRGRPPSVCCLSVQCGTELDTTDMNFESNRRSSPLKFIPVFNYTYIQLNALLLLFKT
jgi:hypothetical protein